MKLKSILMCVSVFTVSGILLSSLGFDIPPRVSAAAVAVTVSSPADAEFVGTSAEDITFGYVASATEFANTNTITVIVSPTLPGALTNCTAPTTDADGDSTPDGAFGSFTTSSAVYTFTAATTDAATTGIDLCLRFPATTPAASYSISVTDTNDNDFGAALVYAGDDNDVNVTAVVGPTLSFNIRNLGDTADTNVCDLGSVDTTTDPNEDAVDDGNGECGYSLAIGTNATNGFTATIEEQGNFTNGVHNMADVANSASFIAGTEAYGLADVTVGAALTTTTKQGNFTTDATPVPATAANIIQSTGPETYTAGTDATDVTTIMHGLAVGAGTPTGVYTHTVTYYVTATF